MTASTTTEVIPATSTTATRALCRAATEGARSYTSATTPSTLLARLMRVRSPTLLQVVAVVLVRT